MDILYLLIPISIVFVILIAWLFIWSVKSGQYEDMEGPAHKILMDNDAIHPEKQDVRQNKNIGVCTSNYSNTSDVTEKTN